MRALVGVLTAVPTISATHDYHPLLKVVKQSSVCSSEELIQNGSLEIN